MSEYGKRMAYKIGYELAAARHRARIGHGAGL